LIVYWAGWETNWKLFVTVALGFVFLGLLHLRGRDLPPLQWRAGATWLLPWLGGLCLISYLGDYPEKSKHVGNTGTIGFGWGFVIVLALTALVWFIALRVRLPREMVEENVKETEAEATHQLD